MLSLSFRLERLQQMGPSASSRLPPLRPATSWLACAAAFGVVTSRPSDARACTMSGPGKSTRRLAEATQTADWMG